MTKTHTKRIHPGVGARDIVGTQAAAGASYQADGCSGTAIQRLTWTANQGNRYGTGHVAKHERDLCAAHAWRER
jgi:hypothetical protein